MKAPSGDTPISVLLRAPLSFARLGARICPMTKTAEQLLKDALKLRSEDRAEMAAELIASLDGDADGDVGPAWADEIERRAHRARSGDDPASPWPEARDRLRGKLSDH